MLPVETSSPRIAYIIKLFPRLSETFILHEVLELERQGVPLHVFSLLQPGGGAEAALQDVHSPVTYLPQRDLRGWAGLLAAAARRLWKDPLKFARVSADALVHFHHPLRIVEILYAACLADWMEQAGISHIHAHYANRPATVAYLVHKFTGIPFSFTAHAKDIYLSHRPSLAYKMRQARLVVTCTGYNQEYLASLLNPQDAVVIQRIYHGLDLGIFPADAHPAAAARPCILSVARLVEKKGLQHLVWACRQLKELGYDFECKIVGEGPLRPQLEQLIAELGLGGCVQLMGALPHERVIAMYAQATVMALPAVIASNGDRDGIPNVLVEAMYMRVPVVSTPVSGIPELLTPEGNGLLAPEHDPAALAKTIARLLDDAELRARLGEAGHQTVIERFDMAANARVLRNLFLNTPVLQPQASPEAPGRRAVLRKKVG